MQDGNEVAHVVRAAPRPGDDVVKVEADID
jgi:hypothetical protein